MCQVIRTHGTSRSPRQPHISEIQHCAALYPPSMAVQVRKRDRHMCYCTEQSHHLAVLQNLAPQQVTIELLYALYLPAFKMQRDRCNLPHSARGLQLACGPWALLAGRGPGPSLLQSVATHRPIGWDGPGFSMFAVSKARPNTNRSGEGSGAGRKFLPLVAFRPIYVQLWVVHSAQDLHGSPPAHV